MVEFFEWFTHNEIAEFFVYAFLIVFAIVAIINCHRILDEKEEEENEDE